MIGRLRAWVMGRPSDSKRLGRAGERRAARFLRRAGYRVLERNGRTRVGEIDLLCLAPDRRTLVIVEVKTRAQPEDPGSQPPPESSITAHKRRKLLQLAGVVARQARWKDHPVRIDVVAIDWPANGRPELRHYPSAVTP